MVLEGSEARRELIKIGTVSNGVVGLLLHGEKGGQPWVLLGTVAEESLLSLTRGAAGKLWCRHVDDQSRIEVAWK